MKVIIRDFREQDAVEVGLLIKNTYSAFNLDFVDPEELPAYLGPFVFAGDENPAHQDAILDVIRSQFVYIAEMNDTIVGILRGRMDRLGSLFVDQAYQKQGIGRALVEHFEKEVICNDGVVIRVASSLYAIPFYLKLGYKRSTGIRNGWSFQGHGLPIQPMKKVL